MEDTHPENGGRRIGSDYRCLDQKCLVAEAGTAPAQVAGCAGKAPQAALIRPPAACVFGRAASPGDRYLLRDGVPLRPWAGERCFPNLDELGAYSRLRRARAGLPEHQWERPMDLTEEAQPLTQGFAHQHPFAGAPQVHLQARTYEHLQPVADALRSHGLPQPAAGVRDTTQQGQRSRTGKDKYGVASRVEKIRQRGSRKIGTELA